MKDFQSEFFRTFSEKRRPLLMAHRGNRKLFPENTIAAFQQAILDGADILETDLHLSTEGEFICIHDATVDRTTNGSGEIKKMALKDLKNLKTIDPENQSTDFQIPTLDETSEILPETVSLALELKTDSFLEPKICLRLASLLSEKKILERTIALSFSLPRLLALKSAVPEMPIGWISMSRLLPDKSVNLIGAFWPIFYFNPWYVHLAHRKGMFVCPLDPAPDARLKYYISKKVDAVLSDDPGKTRRLLDQLLNKKDDSRG